MKKHHSPASREWLYFAATCFCLFMAGWNDGTTGPLLPRMQQSYNIGYTVVSIIFVCNCAGAMCAAASVMWFSDRFGFGITVTLGAAVQCVGLAIASSRPPFPVLAVAYSLGGFGVSLLDAQSNAILTVLPTNQQAKMMMGHGFYGLGAFAAPLVSTQFAQPTRFMLKHWSFHYLASLALALTNLIAVILIFRFRNDSQILKSLDVDPVGHQQATDSSGALKYKQLMSMWIVQTFALFCFIYVGVEVTSGAWSVSYIIQRRHGGPHSGYVSSGFFGGLTVGRFALIWVNKMLGPVRIVLVYSLICFALEITVWRVPSLYENAIAISFVGFFLGPIYPTMILVVSKRIPKRFVSGAVGWIGCIGAGGAATFPFICGVMAQRWGLGVLQPLLIVMTALLLFLWLAAIFIRDPKMETNTGVLERSSGGEDQNKSSPDPENISDRALELLTLEPTASNGIVVVQAEGSRKHVE